MQLVIDANIIISMLIKPGKPTTLLFKEELELFAPELLITEINNNKQIIVKKSNLSEHEIDQMFEIIKNRINIIPETDFLKYKDKAKEICPDIKDIVYFALALHLKCAVWSNEKKLSNQNYIKVYPTHELLQLFKE